MLALASFRSPAGVAKPVAKPTRAGAAAEVGSEHAPAEGDPPFHIWLVDPDPAMQRSVAWLLRHLSIELTSYRYGEDFLNGCDLASPGCVLVDTDLPDMSGLDVVRSVERRGAPGITVLVLASSPDVHLAVQALREGAADFFEKPFLGAALTRRVERAIEESRDRG